MKVKSVFHFDPADGGFMWAMRTDVSPDVQQATITTMARVLHVLGLRPDKPFKAGDFLGRNVVTYSTRAEADDAVRRLWTGRPMAVWQWKPGYGFKRVSSYTSRPAKAA